MFFSFANLGQAADEVVSFPTQLPELPPSNTLSANPSLVWRSDASDPQALDDHALAYRFNNPQIMNVFVFDVRKATPSAQFKFDAYSDLNSPGPSNLLYSSGFLDKDGDYIVVRSDSLISGIHVLNFVIKDPINGRGFHEIERTWAGVSFESKFSIAPGISFSTDNSGSHFRGETGVGGFVPGVSWRVMSARFNLLPHEEVPLLYNILREIGRAGDFFVGFNDTYPEHVVKMGNGFYQLKDFLELEWALSKYFRANLDLQESRGSNPLGDAQNKIAALQQTIANLTGT